jgi:ABC-type branched-subunit amino acid transport system substrate-binding protein
MVALLCATGGGQVAGAASKNSGWTNTSIKVATSLPLSGPAAYYGQEALGADAYFKYINAHGGVKMKDGHTRKIVYKYLDDAYTPSETVTNVRDFLDTFHPAIAFNFFGTDNVQAVFKTLANAQIPVLFPQTGATEFLKEDESDPWLLADGPSYDFEMQATVDYLDQKYPSGSKIALLYQGDEYGADILSGLQEAVKGTKDTIVATASYVDGSTDVSSQIASLASSDATVFINEGIGTPSTDAMTSATAIGWKVPQFIAYGAGNAATLVPAGASANGVYATLWQEDPTDAQWAYTPTALSFAAIGKKYGPSGSEPSESPFYFGMATAQSLVYILQHTTAPTGKAVMAAASSLKNVSLPLIAGNVPINTRPHYPYLITKMAMWQYNNGVWTQVSKPFSEG